MSGLDVVNSCDQFEITQQMAKNYKGGEHKWALITHKKWSNMQR